MQPKFVVFYPVSLVVLILQCIHTFYKIGELPFFWWKVMIYFYLVVFIIGLAFYIYNLFLSIWRQKNKSVFIILFFLGIMLSSQFYDQILLRLGSLWTFFSLEWKSLIAMNNLNMFAYPFVLLCGLIGLFLPRHIGYILSRLVPFYLLCHIMQSFFLTTRSFPDYLIANWQTFLVLMIIAPILYNRKIILDYFKVSLKQKFLYLPISFLIAILTVVWPYFKCYSEILSNSFNCKSVIYMLVAL